MSWTGNRRMSVKSGSIGLVSGDRPHECPVCHKTFVTKDALNKHLIVHTDERNFKCGECGKLFKRIGHVREHLKIHNAERPFPCTVCDKSFKTNVSWSQNRSIWKPCLPPFPPHTFRPTSLFFIMFLTSLANKRRPAVSLSLIINLFIFCQKGEEKQQQQSAKWML